MTNRLYVVYNNLSERYEDVFTSPTDATASRRFMDTANNDLDRLQDFDLCFVGTIDIETGIVESNAPKRVQYQQFKRISFATDKEVK